MFRKKIAQLVSRKDSGKILVIVDCLLTIKALRIIHNW